MIERFRGPDGERRLLEALRCQSLVCNDPSIAEAILGAGAVQELDPASVLIRQGGSDNDLFFIVAGAVSIQVNGREIARRYANQHVGELAVIDPRAPRAAAVVPVTRGAVVRVTEASFAELAIRFPVLWKRIAMELGARLRERNNHVSVRRDTATLFVGASREGLAIAREIQSGLRHDDVTVRVWTDGVFGASHFPLEDLEAQIATADFALLVVTPDDVVTSRSTTKNAPRDNIVFELGLFMGALTRQRTFLLRPRDADLKLPTDLLGLTALEFKMSDTAALSECLALTCNDLRQIIVRLGPQ